MASFFKTTSGSELPCCILSLDSDTERAAATRFRKGDVLLRAGLPDAADAGSA